MWERYRNGQFNHQINRWQLTGRTAGIKLVQPYGFTISETTAQEYQQLAIEQGLIFSEGQGTATYSPYLGEYFLTELTRGKRL